MPEIDAGVGLDCDVYGFGFSLVDKYDIIHAHISAIDGICISPYEECSLSVSTLGIDFPVVSLFSEQDLNEYVSNLDFQSLGNISFGVGGYFLFGAEFSVTINVNYFISELNRI